MCLGVSGCTQAPQQEVAIAPTAKPTAQPTATPKPKPTATPTAREKRAARAEKRRKERAERAERRRLARQKEEQEQAERKRQSEEKRIAAAAAAQREESNELLSDLAFKYLESETQISAGTRKAQELLRDAGLNDSEATIMGAMNDAMPRRLLDADGVNHQSYAEYLALYIVDRKQGISKDEIVSALKVLTDQ